MSYANITNPANFQLQDFAQFGFRVITTDFIPVPGEQYRTLYVLQDAVVTATTQKGDDITSKAILAGTLLHGLFNSVSITSGRVLAYAAGRVTAEEIIALYEAYVIALGGTLENAQCAVDTINEDGVDFFADASLVMIPEGYATGVVYGQRPLTSDSQLTFTRASTATRVGPDGAIEKVRTNLLTYSNTISDASWIKSATGITVTGGQAGYDGTNNAWLITKDAASFKFVRKALTAPTGISTFSVYMKAGTLTTAALRLLSTPDVQVVFNLNTGEVISNLNALAVSSQSVGNGWFRYSISGNMTTLAEQVIYPDGITTTNAGNILIQAAQFEVGDVMTDYIETTSTAVSVGILSNVPRIDYTGGGCGKLLLEPQRTNLALYSEQMDNAVWSQSRGTITANAIASPDVYTNADLWSQNAGEFTAAALLQNVSVTSGTAYSFSVFAKKQNKNFLGIRANAISPTPSYFDLENGTLDFINPSHTAKIEDYGNGWYRCTISYTSNVTGTTGHIFYPTDGSSLTVTDSGGIYLWGAQLEAGAYPTSYIPTTAAAVTRLADSCSKTGISSLIGQTQGTIFVDFQLNQAPSDTNGRLLSLWATNDTTDAILPFINQSLQLQISTFRSSVGNPVISAGASTLLGLGQNKIAVAYTSTSIVVYRNGVLFASGNTTGVFPTSLTSLDLGNSSFSARSLGSPISQALLFKTRLTNEQLQKLTSL